MTLSASGDGASFDSVQSFLKIYATEDPEPPNLISVEFTPDGMNLLAIFDDETDQYPSSSSETTFECKELFEFRRKDRSINRYFDANYGGDDEGVESCRWLSTKVVNVALKDKTQESNPVFFLSPSDYVTLYDSKVKAKSQYATKYSPSVQLNITMPLPPLIPAVSLSTSAVVGICDDIVLDPTLSSGHGGREWKSVVWSIREPDTAQFNKTAHDITFANNTQKVIDHLNTYYQNTNDVVTIPQSLLTHGQTYNIRLSLTNALNEVGAATVQVEVLATLRDNYQRITQTGLTPKVMISSLHHY